MRSVADVSSLFRCDALMHPLLREETLYQTACLETAGIADEVDLRRIRIQIDDALFRLEHVLVLGEGGLSRASHHLAQRLVIDRVVAATAPEIVAARRRLGGHRIEHD